MFDEMFLQKCEKYCGGKMVGADPDDNLYKGVVSFTICGLKETVSYVVKSIPETSINGECLKTNI